jgi:TonB-dependent SusC/RagA subfamily outer membrane receptor
MPSIRHHTSSFLASRSTFAVALSMLASVACAHGKSPGGTQSAPGATTASTVSTTEIARAPNETVEQYLNGRFSGVNISPTADGGLTIRVRGQTSVHGSNAPLYILDGVAIQPDANGSLSGINPYDIQSIKVLKDLADITMYGVRGANGVIVIKTKQKR